MHRGRVISGRTPPQITAWPYSQPQITPKREQTLVLAQENQQTFAQKQVTTNAFFL